MRCRSLLLTATVTLAATIGPSTPAAVAGAASGSWPEARAGSSRQGWNRQETAISSATVAKLKLVWTDTAAADGEPLVDGNRVYIRTYESSFDVPHTLRALDRATGALAWSRIGITFAVSNGAVIYLLVHESDAAGWLAEARRASDGGLLWSTKMPAGFEEWGTIGITLHLGYLAITSWWSPDDLDYGGILFLNPKTGTIVSTLNLSLDPDGWAPIPTAADGVVYQGTPVRAIAVPGGAPKPLARQVILRAGDPPLIATGKQLIDVQSDVTVAYDLTGKLRWSSPAPVAGKRPSVAADAARVYIVRPVGTTKGTSSLSALSMASGTVLWSATRSGQLQAPAVANGLLFAAEGRSGVTAFDAVSGTVRWTLPGVADSTPPVIANGQLVVGYSPSKTTNHAPVSLFSLG